MEVNTPFYSGKLEALVMPSPLYDVIIGNVPGARGPGDPDPLFAETAAVETRSQMQKSSKGVKPLVTPAQREGISATPEDLNCLLYTSPSPRDRTTSRMPSSA